MVRCNDIYSVFIDRFEKSCPVTSGFNGGVPFDFGAQLFIICIGKPKMVNTNFRSYFLVFDRGRFKQGNFGSCREVQDV